MTKRFTKRFTKYKSKKGLRKNKKTRKIKYGGDHNQEIIDEQAKKYRFRQNFKDLIIQITNKKNTNQAINSIISNFKNNIMINTLIPASATGKPLDVKTYSKKNPVVDFVSPVSIIFDNLTGIIGETDIIKLLNAYYINGGNFNNLSSRFKISPLQNEINKKRVQNVKILLDKSNPFHIIENGLDEETRTKLAELIPNEQMIISQPTPVPEATSVPEVISEKLTLPYPLPEVEYDRKVVPEFWKPIFQNGEELMRLREVFMHIYENDKYKDNNVRTINICNILERLFPGYLTKYTLDDVYNVPKFLVTVNIVNCIITLLYGIITYRLYDSKNNYLLLFKGGRALQLSLNDIANVKKYFSEDTDVLIIPNKSVNSEYNIEKMQNLSEHIGYLVKWFIPEDINIIVSLPSNPKNLNKEITKLVYNDGKFFRAVSDIGFGDMDEDIKRYFDNPSYSPFYVDDFETTALFITPTLDDMLNEKLYFYSKYSNMKQKLEKGEPITEKGYEQLTEEDCNYYKTKFFKAIKHMVSSIIKRDYANLDIVNEEANSTLVIPDEIKDMNKYKRQEKEQLYRNINDTSRLILRGIISNYDDYSNEEKERIINELYA